VISPRGVQRAGGLLDDTHGERRGYRAKLRHQHFDIGAAIDGVVRIESSPREKATPIILEKMRSVYPHDEVFGQSCTVNDYIDRPPDELFDYLSDTRSLEEWTYSPMGSGTGVTAVSAALAGCRRVTALDISSAAVENTRRNVVRHNVADRVDVRRSDLFDALSAGERFDLIYWNSNFVEAPKDFVNASDLHHAFFDPGYETHRRYLLQAPYHLSQRGRLLLGFSDLGSWEQLRTACDSAGLTAEVLHAQRCQLETSIEFQLVELRPADRVPWTP
jgi:release factor glutamine methyltransferase